MEIYKYTDVQSGDVEYSADPDKYREDGFFDRMNKQSIKVLDAEDFEQPEPVQDEAWQAAQKANADYAIKCATEAQEGVTAQQQQDPVAVRAAIVVNLVREGINKHRARELADHFIGLTPPPHKLPTPPGQAPIADTCFAEGWNACCDAFFGGLPPPEPLIVTVTQEVLTQRKPLTNAEMDDCLRRAGVIATLEVLRCIGREVEAAHGIKDTP